MKRSEMENILQIHLENQLDIKDADYEARIILTILESNGMLPPAIEVKKKKFLYMDINPEGTEFAEYDEYFETQNIWEQE